MWGERESLTANDDDLISVSLKIILAPSFGRREKRSCVYRHRYICGEADAFSAVSAATEAAPTISFLKGV